MIDVLSRHGDANLIAIVNDARNGKLCKVAQHRNGFVVADTLFSIGLFLAVDGNIFDWRLVGHLLGIGTGGRLRFALLRSADLVSLHGGDGAGFGAVLDLTGRATSGLPQLGDELVAHMTAPRDFAVCPLAPLGVVEQLAYGAALILVRPLPPVGRVRAGGKKRCIAQSTGDDVTGKLRRANAFCGLKAVKAISQNVSRAVIKNRKRRKRGSVLHGLDVLINKRRLDARAGLYAIVDMNLVEGDYLSLVADFWIVHAMIKSPTNARDKRN